jgi:hypothetical protein
MADAPDTSSYLLISNDPLLVNNRQIASVAGIDLIDTGPGGQLVIAPGDTLLALQSLTDVGFLTQTVNGTLAARALVSDGSIAITNPQGVAGNVNLTVVDNTSSQNINVFFEGSLVANTGSLTFIPGAGVGMNVVSTGTTVEVTVLSSGGAVSDGTYIVQTPDAALTSAQALSSLTPGGIMKCNSSGVVSIAQAGVDYQAASANLTALAALSPSLGSMIVGTGSAWIARGIGSSGQVPVSNGTDWAWGTVGGGGAPTGATYITQTPSTGLSAEQALSSLTPGGIMKCDSGGIVSIAQPGVDYYVPITTTNTPCTLVESGTKIFLGANINRTGVAGSSQLVIVGSGAAALATGANGSVIVGFGAAATQLDYPNSVLVGHGADATSTGLTNSGAFGYSTVYSQSNMIALGNGARVCISRANPGLIADAPWAIQLGLDNAAIDPQIMMLPSTDPDKADIPINGGVISVDAGLLRFSTADAGSFTTGGSFGIPVYSGTLTGTTGYVLTSNGPTDAPTWEPGMTNPMTTIGDMIVATTDGEPIRLPAHATQGYVLTSGGAGVTPDYAPPLLPSQVTTGPGGAGMPAVTSAFTLSAGLNQTWTPWDPLQQFTTTVGMLYTFFVTVYLEADTGNLAAGDGFRVFLARTTPLNNMGYGNLALYPVNMGQTAAPGLVASGCISFVGDGGVCQVNAYVDATQTIVVNCTAGRIIGFPADDISAYP